MDDDVEQSSYKKLKETVFEELLLLLLPLPPIMIIIMIMIMIIMMQLRIIMIITRMVMIITLIRPANDRRARGAQELLPAGVPEPPRRGRRGANGAITYNIL